MFLSFSLVAGLFTGNFPKNFRLVDKCASLADILLNMQLVMLPSLNADMEDIRFGIY